MDFQQALSLLHLEGEDAGELTADTLRRQYLRLALQTHPDKNPGDPGAAERFQQLGAAHAALLEAAQRGAAARHEQRHASAILDLLLRALCGEAVEAELRALGEYRPPADFGVDPTVAFDARVPPASPHSPGDGGQPDLAHDFRQAFQQEGLTDEGDPLGGYALPPDAEIC